MNTINQVSQQTITILVCLTLTIVALIVTTVIVEHETLPVLGACFAGPIVSLRGFAYLKTGDTRKGWMQMTSGAVILAILGARLGGIL